MRIAIDVDLDPLEPFLADQTMRITHARCRQELAHEIVERLDEPADDVPLPRSEFEMPDKLCRPVHATREQRIGGLHRRHEQRIGKLARPAGVDAPRYRRVRR
jgi:hypothetical protein